MIFSCNISTLRTLSNDLLNDALREISSHRIKNSPDNEERFLTAEYILEEAKEYVDGSWKMLKSGKPNASIALSRWILEASLNLLWTVAEEDKIEERLRDLVGEALRLEACLLEDLPKLWPDKRDLFENSAKKARKKRKELGVVDRLKYLAEMLEEIEHTRKEVMEKLYPLYRICCASAHPSLKVHERFCIIDGKVSSKDQIEKQSIACWMAAASTLYLVTNAYVLTKLGDIDVLNKWWEEQFVPLLT